MNPWLDPRFMHCKKEKIHWPKITGLRGFKGLRQFECFEIVHAIASGFEEDLILSVSLDTGICFLIKQNQSSARRIHWWNINAEWVSKCICKHCRSRWALFHTTNQLLQCRSVSLSKCLCRNGIDFTLVEAKIEGFFGHPVPTRICVSVGQVVFTLESQEGKR